MENTAKRNLMKPQGTEGMLTGVYMAQENYEINLWAIDMLNIQPADHILEIGFGPGVAIEEMAKRAKNGHITGIDYSELMLNQAKKRNEQSIQQCCVDLKQASVNDLPDFGKTFDKVIAINNVMYWENQPEALVKLKPLLKPGGMIALILQRGEEMLKAGGCHDEIGYYVQCLCYAGYVNVQVCIQPVAKAARKYSKTAQTMGLAWGKEVPSHNIAGICISAQSPMPYGSLAEYYQAMQAYQSSQRKMSFMRTANLDFLFTPQL